MKVGGTGTGARAWVGGISEVYLGRQVTAQHELVGSASHLKEAVSNSRISTDAH